MTIKISIYEYLILFHIFNFPLLSFHDFPRKRGMFLKLYGHLVIIPKVPVHGGKTSSEHLPPVIILKKQPKRLDPLEIKARKTSADKSGGSQDEKNIVSPTPQLSKATPPESKPKSQQPEKPIQQQPQLTNKVAQAISAVKAKVIAPKEKSKPDASTNAGKKSIVNPNSSSAASDVKSPEDKSKQAPSSNAGKKNVANPNVSSPISDIKPSEVKQILVGNNTKESGTSEKGAPTSKILSTPPNNQQPLQMNNHSNRLVAEVKPMPSIATNIKKPNEEANPLNHEFNDEEVRNETVKKAAEKFEKETMKANNIGRGGGGFGAYRERSKSIGNSLAHKMATDVEDVDYEEDSITTSSSMLPWANDNNIGKSSTPAVVRKRNSIRGMGAYQLRMSKSSDSITAAKLLAEARMRETTGYQDDMEGLNNQFRGRQNYHKQKTLRINAQNYAGVGGRGEMSKSIEKQIDVYTKTREDIRRILTVAKKCSVAERVKLLDNQQIEPEEMASLETDGKCVERALGTQASGVVNSRYKTGYL